jgi:hypothetical protein
VGPREACELYILSGSRARLTRHSSQHDRSRSSKRVSPHFIHSVSRCRPIYYLPPATARPFPRQLAPTTSVPFLVGPVISPRIVYARQGTLVARPWWRGRRRGRLAPRWRGSVGQLDGKPCGATVGLGRERASSLEMGQRRGPRRILARGPVAAWDARRPSLTTFLFRSIRITLGRGFGLLLCPGCSIFCDSIALLFVSETSH